MGSFWWRSAVSLEVKAGVVVLAGEGVVLAICKVLPVKFGYMKVGFDVTLVVVACLLSVIFTGQLLGRKRGNRCSCDICRADRETDRQGAGTVESGKGVGKIPTPFS